MKLSVLERVLLGNMMSEYQCNFTVLKVMRECREAISFKDDELMKLKFEQSDGKLKWDPNAAVEIGNVNIDFGEAALHIIKEIFVYFNDTRKLTEQHFSLCEKFLI